MDAPLQSDHSSINNSSELFTTVSHNNTGPLAFSPAASATPQTSNITSAVSDYPSLPLNKRKSELIAGVLRTPCPKRANQDDSSDSCESVGAGQSDFLVVQSTPVPGRVLESSFGSYIESQSFDTVHLEDRERYIYTAGLESSADTSVSSDRFREPVLASPSVLSSRKIVSASRPRSQHTSSNHSDWFDRVCENSSLPSNIEGQPSSVPGPVDLSTPASGLSFAGDACTGVVYPENSPLAVHDPAASLSFVEDTRTTGSTDSTITSNSIVVPSDNTSDSTVLDFDMNPEKFQELFQRCFNEAITSEGNVSFIRNVLSGELNTLNRKVDVATAESKVATSGVVKLTADIYNVDARLRTCEGSIQNITQSLDRVGRDLNNLIEQGLPVAHSDQLNQVQLQVTNLTGEVNRIRQEPLAQAEGEGMVNEIRSLTTKVQQLEATSNLKMLIFDGIPEIAGENVPEHLVQFLNGAFDVPLKLGDIETARRIGTVRPGRPKSILVEFVYVSVRRRVYRDRLQLTRTKPNVYISEFLPKDVEYLFYLARRERGENRPLARVWTWDCQVYATRVRNSRGVLIRNERELREFIALPFYGPEVRPAGWVGGPSTSQRARDGMDH